MGVKTIPKTIAWDRGKEKVLSHMADKLVFQQEILLELTEDSFLLIHRNLCRYED